MRRWKNNICFCDYYPEACRAHPFALEAMGDDDVCHACGVIGPNEPAEHFAGCIDDEASRAPGPQYDVSMLITFAVHVWEDQHLILNETHKAYSLADLEPVLQTLRTKYTEAGANRTLRVSSPYSSSATALRVDTQP